MRSGIRGVLAGALALVTLQLLLQPFASNRIGGLAKVPGDIARRFIDPTIPAIPDRRGGEEGPNLRSPKQAAKAGQQQDRYPDPFSRTVTPATAPGGD